MVSALNHEDHRFLHGNPIAGKDLRYRRSRRYLQLSPMLPRTFFVSGAAQTESLQFVPIDFTEGNLEGALRQSPFHAWVPTFFGWLGVTYYLARDAVFDTRRSRRAAAWSSLISCGNG